MFCQNIREKISFFLKHKILLFHLSSIIVYGDDPKKAILTFSKDTKFINAKNFTKPSISQSHCLWECIHLPDYCHSACFSVEEQKCFLNYEVDEEYQQNTMTSQQGWLYFQQYQVRKNLEIFYDEIIKKAV